MVNYDQNCKECYVHEHASNIANAMSSQENDLKLIVFNRKVFSQYFRAASHSQTTMVTYGLLQLCFYIIMG